MIEQPRRPSRAETTADMFQRYLQLRVGRCTANGIIVEYRINLSGGYIAQVTKSAANRWRLVIHGGIEQDLGLFNTTAAALVKVQEYEMLAAARRVSQSATQRYWLGSTSDSPAADDGD